MKTFVKYVYTTFFYSTLLTLCSCEQFIEISSPKTQLTSSEVFSSDATASGAVANIYASMASGGGPMGGGTASISVLCGIAADDSDAYSTSDLVKQIYQNNILSGNTLITALWADSYNIIYQANTVIEGVEKSEKISPAVKRQLTGESLFIRAFAHFNVSNIYGDLPYISTTDYRVNTKAARMGTEQVLEMVVADLKTAKELLNADYSGFAQERIRVSKWAAIALLSRAYLYQGDWKNAESEADLLLNEQSLFKLTELGEVFLKNSKEAILQLKPVTPTINTLDGAVNILVAKPNWCALRSTFKSAFESGDLRKTNWIGNFTNTAGSWDFAYKYKIRTGDVPLNEYSMVLRLAEQFLIRAEARLKQNKLSEAIADLDAIRFRAGLKKISVTNPGIAKEDLLRAIQQERRVELFTEWGHRWADLKRWGLIDEIMAPLKTGWKSDYAVFPIPASEVKVNPNMVQNPGYN